MQDLITCISAAVAAGATTEQKAAGVTACRTILAALDTTPGTAFAMPGVAPTPPGPRISVDQVLDLMIARLTPIASEHDRRAQEAQQVLPAPSPPLAAPTQTQGLAVAARGLRIPPAARVSIAAPRKSAQAKSAAPASKAARKP
jgi:hypothetical protein